VCGGVRNAIFVVFGNLTKPTPPPPHTDILVPRARENLVAIEMVASEVARRVETETVRAAAGVAPTPRPATGMPEE
jgi:hypothetical protein